MPLVTQISTADTAENSSIILKAHTDTFFCPNEMASALHVALFTSGYCDLPFPVKTTMESITSKTAVTR